MVTQIGLGQVNRSGLALTIPMLYDSWEQLDYVRDKMSPKLEQEFEKGGMVVLQWGDGGWVHQFCKSPCKTPDELRKMKLLVWSGDPESEKAWRGAGFNPIPLSTTDVMSALQTGMIDAFGTTPLFALTSTWYQHAKNMTKINWTPLNGATIVVKSEWEKIDEKLRPELLKIAREEGQALNTAVRKMSDNAIKAMTDRGLSVTVPDAAGVEEWRKAAQAAYPDIRGKIIPNEVFDEAKKLAEEFKAKK
jgi:TRAP-type C4-dicarboxylate transport system substrate-binding protein